MRALPDKRASGMPGLPARSRDLPLSELPDSRTAGEGSLRVSQDPVLLNRDGLNVSRYWRIGRIAKKGLAYDFVPDQLADGRRFGALTVVGHLYPRKLGR